ncbi:MAG: hypothetical protein WEC35_06170 [Nitrosopumilaceae archaeon]
MEYKLIKQIFDTVNSHTKFLLAISILVIFTQMPSATADPPVWDSISYTLNDGNVFTGVPVIINVTDASYAIGNPSDGGIDTITITITSTDDPTGITLTLTENSVNDGVFGNTNLIFMTGDDLYTIGSTTTVTIEDPVGVGDPAIQTLTGADAVRVVSTSDPVGFIVDLTETGSTTGVFTATIRFGTSTDDTTNTIGVAPGDIVSVRDNFNSEITNGLIIPNPNSGLGAIKASIGIDAVTATYGVDSTPVEISDSFAPGRGGGGLVRPGLVLDVVAALSGNGGRDRSPPAFALSLETLLSMPLSDSIKSIIQLGNPFIPIPPVENSLSDLPLVIDDKGFAISAYSNTIETQIAETGEPMKLRLNLRDSTGVEHIAIYTNLRGNEREVSDSDTWIFYNENKPLEIVDPHNFFLNANFTEHEEGDKYTADFDIVFAKPMEKSDIIIRIWDQKRNSIDTKIFDAIVVKGDELVKDGIHIDTQSAIIPHLEVSKYIMPMPDYNGNLVYYNSFGTVENKKTHPYHDPAVYPDSIGRLERHQEKFSVMIDNEIAKADVVVKRLIIDPFVKEEISAEHKPFNYPSYVGALDREDIIKIEQEKLHQHLVAAKIFAKYKTNHIED